MTGDAAEEADVLAAAKAGDHAAFSALTERHRRALRVHCYRMLGSFDEAEDLVQETLLRAWRAREDFQGRSLFRTWLYRIATNACLNALERTPRRVLPEDVIAPVTAATPSSEARSAPPLRPELPWLQPFPSALVEPEQAIASRESIGLAFLAALQHLPGRQRAILILTDVVGLSAKEVAELLEDSVPAVTSALQRAHTALRSRLPEPRASTSEAERAALRAFMKAWESGDVSELTALLREDARWAMPPAALWFSGRAAIVNMLTLYPPKWQGREFKLVEAGANLQPAAAAYLRRQGESAFQLSGVHVLRLEDQRIAEITTFAPELCLGFRLAPSL